MPLDQFKNLSKYRHVYCDAPKQETCHTGLRLSTVTGDQQYIKASSKYFAVALSGGGGMVYVGRHDRPGRYLPGSTPTLSGHRGAVLDFDWNPFDDSMLATASEDTTIKLWKIPKHWEPIDSKGVVCSKDGQSGSITESTVDLGGHGKKVNLLRFHPSASNILASTGYEKTVKLWDIEASQELSTFDEMTEICQDIAWDYTGDNYAISCKDKTVKFVDARSATVTREVKAHGGSKCVKVVYMGDSGKVLTTGHSLASEREVKIWDARMPMDDNPLTRETIDSASGVLMPMYDADTNVVYLCGKGDGNVRPCEFVDGAPHFSRLSAGFQSTVPLKGVCLVPKRGLDVMECETARLLKVTHDANTGVQPLSFRVPRKSGAFQEDIFPDTASVEPAHAAEQWWGGSRRGPRLESLDPARRGEPTRESTSSSSAPSSSKGWKSTMSMNKLGHRSNNNNTAGGADGKSNVDASSLLAHIGYLEGKLDAAGIKYDRMNGSVANANDGSMSKIGSLSSKSTSQPSSGQKKKSSPFIANGNDGCGLSRIGSLSNSGQKKKSSLFSKMSLNKGR